MSKFMRSERERKGCVFGGGIMQRRGYFMRSRFMRSLKKESMEPMDGALFAPHPASVPAG
jgi:hypothetical protein